MFYLFPKICLTEYDWDDDEWEILTKTTNTYELL